MTFELDFFGLVTLVKWVGSTTPPLSGGGGGGEGGAGMGTPRHDERNKSGHNQ